MVCTREKARLEARKHPFRSKKVSLKKQENKKQEARDMSSICKANHTYYLLLITYYLKMKQENALKLKDKSLASYFLTF